MKRIVVAILAVTAAYAAEKPLFNGKNLDGWARIPRHENAPGMEKPGIEVQDGLLV